jgi:GTP cyclohydrolase I
MTPIARSVPLTLIAPPEPDLVGRRIDLPAAERAAGELLVALGADLADEGLRETPRTRQEFLALTTRTDHVH